MKKTYQIAFLKYEPPRRTEMTVQAESIDAAVEQARVIARAPTGDYDPYRHRPERIVTSTTDYQGFHMPACVWRIEDEQLPVPNHPAPWAVERAVHACELLIAAIEGREFLGYAPSIDDAVEVARKAIEVASS